MVTPLRKAMQLLPLFQRIWSERQLHQEMARFDGCLFISSKVWASNTPKLQSPWLILKGSWFPRCKWPNDGSYLYNVWRSISSSWQISGQCKQSGSRGERARKTGTQAGVPGKTLQHFAKGCKAKGICERHASLSWSLEVQFWFWGRNACLPFAWLCKNAAGIQGNSCPHNTQLSQMTPPVLEISMRPKLKSHGLLRFLQRSTTTLSQVPPRT